MGTSSLYKGPKKTVLLPSDYNPEEGLGESLPAAPPEGTDPDKVTSEEGEQQPEALDNGVEQQPSQPGAGWSAARSGMTRAMNNRSLHNVKHAIRTYTKALGGHSNATRQATSARRTAGVIYTYFSGTPDTIRKRFEESGIQFDGRSTKDIFSDIFFLLAPIPNDLEDSLANKALQETFADVAVDDSIDLGQLDSFNEELLQRLVGGMIKHYIFDKLVQQTEQGALKKCDSNSRKLQELEKTIKIYIDGIVDGVVGDVVRSGLSPADFNKVVEALFDAAYQRMEEL